MKKLVYLILSMFLSFLLFSACTQGNKNKQNNTNDTSKTNLKISTKDNITAAINQEIILGAKYTAYAIKAKEEGYTTVQHLFDGISKATSIHITNLTKALEKLGGKVAEIKPVFDIKTTKENLEEAIKNESDLTTRLFPQYIEQADKEGFDDASIAFTWTNDTKKKYIEMFNNAINALKKNTINTISATYFVCPRCGNIFDLSNVEEECSFCGTGKEKYVIFK